MSSEEERIHRTESGRYEVGDTILSPRGVFLVTRVIDARGHVRTYRADWVDDPVYHKRPVPGRPNDRTRREDVVVKQIMPIPRETEADFRLRVTREAKMTLHLIPTRLGEKNAADFCGKLASCAVEEFQERNTAARMRTPLRSFLVFPWMRGAIGLDDYVERAIHLARPRPDPVVRDLILASIAYDVFAALLYLTSIKVIQNDIKPDNFISYYDSYDERRVQMIDFGAACSTSPYTQAEINLAQRDPRTLTPKEADQVAKIRAYNYDLECGPRFKVLPLLRDPLAGSTEMFPSNRTYRSRLAIGRNAAGAEVVVDIVEIAFDDPKQRRTYFPIFERYAVAAMIVYLYNYSYWSLPSNASFPIRAQVRGWSQHPIPESLFRLIKACTTLGNHRATAEEAMNLAEAALRDANTRYVERYGWTKLSEVVEDGQRDGSSGSSGETEEESATSSSTRSAKTPSPP